MTVRWMADEVPAGFSLKRWSRRKLEATRLAREASAPPIVGTAADPAAAQPPTEVAATLPSTSPAVSAEPELPPVASLSFESDFSVFLQPKVEEGLKREALKKLFSDPRFNVMDGLDTYIDDYSRPDPISDELIREMTQSRYIFDPPQTRINSEGFAEDVPVGEQVASVDALDNDATKAASATPAAAASAPNAAASLPNASASPPSAAASAPSAAASLPNASASAPSAATSPPSAAASPPSPTAMPAIEVPTQSTAEPESGAGAVPSPAQSPSR
jgi:hypothetical protein